MTLGKWSRTLPDPFMSECTVIQAQSRMPSPSCDLNVPPTSLLSLRVIQNLPSRFRSYGVEICFAYLIVSRKSSGILWQNLLHGITHGDFGLGG